jgi:hypothetical protein
VYVPVAGEIRGVAAGRFIVMTDVATALVLKPEATAMAFTVVVPLAVNDVPNSVELVVGVVPSVV